MLCILSVSSTSLTADARDTPTDALRRRAESLTGYREMVAALRELEQVQRRHMASLERVLNPALSHYFENWCPKWFNIHPQIEVRGVMLAS